MLYGPPDRLYEASAMLCERPIALYGTFALS